MPIDKKKDEHRPLDEIMAKEIPFLVEAGGGTGLWKQPPVKRFEKMYKSEDVYEAVKCAQSHIDQMIEYLEFADRCERRVKVGTEEPLIYKVEDMVNGLKYAKNCMVIAFPAAFTREDWEMGVYNHNRVKYRGREAEMKTPISNDFSKGLTSIHIFSELTHPI